MIFNPLFLSEQGNNQIIAPKSNKLSSNKYLFSDIVKVVMNPTQEGKSKTTNVIGSNNELATDSVGNITNLNLKYISELENENPDLGLVALLPPEIAKLLLKGDDLSDDKIISYISQEPLMGELQQFLNDLVGKKLIDQNLSESSGLLVSLEDQKSTVNLELVKESSSKKSSDKIIVQTLVVPKKSKLMSYISNNQNLSTNTNSSENSEKIVQNKLIENGEQNVSKPLLSVYSFNHNSDKLHSFIGGKNSNPENLFKLNIIKGNELKQLNAELSKTNINKISFVPSDQKQSAIEKTALSTSDEKKSKISINGLKIVNINNEHESKDFNVNKITILKKNIEGELGDKGNSPAKLKRIDFSKMPAADNKLNQLNNKDGLHFLKLNGKVNEAKKMQSNNAFENLKINSKTDSDKVIDERIQSKATSKLEKVEGIPNTNSSKEATTKINDENIRADNSKQAKSLESEKNKSTSSQKTENNSKETKLELNKENLAFSSKKVEDTSKSNFKELEKPSGKIAEKNEAMKSNEVQLNTESKERTEENLQEPGRNKQGIKNPVANSKSEQSEIIKTDSTENAKISEAQVGIDRPKNAENRKVSVKVKSNIKNISDKNEKLTEEPATKQNEFKNDDSDFENNDKNNSQNSHKLISHIPTKDPFEQTLHHSLRKDDLTQQINTLEKGTEVEQNTNQRIIKSVEVIREITRFISRQEKGTLSFDIKPEHLGKMKITLDTADHSLRARIDVESEHARQLIERNLDKLHQELNNNGIKLSSLNISLGFSKQQKGEQNFENKGRSYSQNIGQVGETIEEEQKKSLGYNTYEYIA